MKIITISREFGSGGRELGKRLADLTGFDYYDSEIISAVAKTAAWTPTMLKMPWQTTVGRIIPSLSGGH